jgi:hypothetical protein
VTQVRIRGANLGLSPTPIITINKSAAPFNSKGANFDLAVGVEEQNAMRYTDFYGSDDLQFAIISQGVNLVFNPALGVASL